ncbi:hypothetical protein JVT61DRAFT_9905 [Boletus reticuloceps]|uniref:Uncharacterized protein n=1 Tax=Boletus reticuloceps TaxID=495285 RepID=A0A8I3A4C6_9AGAM|nr:hypothetical protein JVT61DRAFT_9905 [Boletus reticuloceps]
MTPDLSIILMPMNETAKNYELPIIGECTFSQDRLHLEYKLQCEIEAHPEVIMVVMIIVSEVKDYHCPHLEELKVWDVFSAEPECRDFESFLSLRELLLPGNSSVVKPVRVTGRALCNISNVKYYVWVKNNAGDNINITNRDPEYMAHGVCNLNLAPNFTA